MSLGGTVPVEIDMCVCVYVYVHGSFIVFTGNSLKLLAGVGLLDFLFLL